MSNMFIIIEDNKEEMNLVCICSRQEKAEMIVNTLNKANPNSHYYYEEKNSYYCYMYLNC